MLFLTKYLFRLDFTSFLTLNYCIKLIIVHCTLEFKISMMLGRLIKKCAPPPLNGPFKFTLYEKTVFILYEMHLHINF